MCFVRMFYVKLYVHSLGDKLKRIVIIFMFQILRELVPISMLSFSSYTTARGVLRCGWMKWILTANIHVVHEHSRQQTGSWLKGLYYLNVKS